MVFSQIIKWKFEFMFNLFYSSLKSQLIIVHNWCFSFCLHVSLWSALCSEMNCILWYVLPCRIISKNVRWEEATILQCMYIFLLLSLKFKWWILEMYTLLLYAFHLWYKDVRWKKNVCEVEKFQQRWTTDFSSNVTRFI